MSTQEFCNQQRFYIITGSNNGREAIFEAWLADLVAAELSRERRKAAREDGNQEIRNIYIGLAEKDQKLYLTVVYSLFRQKKCNIFGF